MEEKKKSGGGLKFKCEHDRNPWDGELQEWQQYDTSLVHFSRSKTSSSFQSIHFAERTIEIYVRIFSYSYRVLSCYPKNSVISLFNKRLTLDERWNNVGPGKHLLEIFGKNIKRGVPT